MSLRINLPGSWNCYGPWPGTQVGGQFPDELPDTHWGSEAAGGHACIVAGTQLAPVHSSVSTGVEAGGRLHWSLHHHEHPLGHPMTNLCLWPSAACLELFIFCSTHMECRRDKDQGSHSCCSSSIRLIKKLPSMPTRSRAPVLSDVMSKVF